MYQLINTYSRNTYELTDDKTATIDEFLDSDIFNMSFAIPEGTTLPARKSQRQKIRQIIKGERKTYYTWSLKGTDTSRSNKGKSSGKQAPYHVYTTKDGSKLRIVLDMESDKLELEEFDLTNATEYTGYSHTSDDKQNDNVELSCSIFDDIKDFELNDNPKYDNRIRLPKKADGEYGIGTIHWAAEASYKGQLFSSYEDVAIIPKYGDDADEYFGRADHGDVDINTTVDAKKKSWLERTLDDNENFYADSDEPEADIPYVVPDFEPSLEFCTRKGAKFLNQNPDAIANTTIIPLTATNIEKLSTTDFAFITGQYSKAVENGELPADCHSLYISNNGKSGVVLNTRKVPNADKYSKWTDWKARVIHVDYKPLAGLFPLAKSSESLHINRKVLIVEGQNDALTAYASLIGINEDIIVINVATAALTELARRFYGKILDWNRNEYVVFLDKASLSEKVARELQSKLGIPAKSIAVAQHHLDDLEDGIDPDDFFSELDSDDNHQIEMLLGPVTPVTEKRYHPTDDVTAEYIKFTDISKVFTRFQTPALRAMGLTDLTDMQVPQVANIDFYNKAEPELKTLISVTAEGDPTSTLKLGRDKDTQDLLSKDIFSDEDFLNAQAPARMCKVFLAPTRGIPKTYFDHVEWNDTAKAVWDECDGDIAEIQKKIVDNSKLIRIVTQDKTKIIDKSGEAIEVISNSIKNRGVNKGKPSLRYNTASLGAGKSLGLGIFLVDEACIHYREVFPIAIRALNDEITSSEQSLQAKLRGQYQKQFPTAAAKQKADKENAKRYEEAKAQAAERDIATLQHKNASRSKDTQLTDLAPLEKASISYKKVEPDDAAAKIEKLQQWVNEIKPFIEHISQKDSDGEFLSWINLEGDLSGSIVPAGNLAEMINIIEEVYYVIAISNPGMIIVNSNEELDAFAALFALLCLDCSTVEALNADNFEGIPTKSAYVSEVAYPVITLARFKQSSFTYYKFKPRYIIFDERPQLGSKHVDESIVADVCDLIREIAEEKPKVLPDLGNLVDGYVRELTDSLGKGTGKFVKKRFTGSLDELRTFIDLKLAKQFGQATSDTNPATDSKSRDMFRKLKPSIELLSIDKKLPKFLCTVPSIENYPRHSLAVQEAVNRLAEIYIMIALNQPGAPEDPEEETNLETNIKWLFPAFTNEWLIFDGTAALANSKLDISFKNLRVWYPRVHVTKTKILLSDITWNVTTRPLFGRRLVEGSSSESFSVGESKDYKIRKKTYLSMLHTLRDSQRLPADITKDEHIGIARDYSQLALYARDDLGTIIKPRQKATVSKHHVRKIDDVGHPAEPLKTIQGDCITWQYGTCEISVEVRKASATSHSVRSKNIMKAFDNESAKEFLVDVIKAYQQSNHNLLKQVCKQAVQMHQKDETKSLFVAYNFTKADFIRYFPADETGTSREVLHTGHSFEGIWPFIQAETAEELNVDLSIVEEAAIAIGHLTKQAVGSNSYGDCNRIVLLHEPFKPDFAVKANSGVQGKDLTSFGDMVANLAQAVGRGCVRTGSMTGCKPMTVESYDITSEVMDGVKQYFDAVTWDVSRVPSRELNVALKSENIDELNAVYAGFGPSKSIYDFCSKHTREVCQAIINYRFNI